MVVTISAKEGFVWDDSYKLGNEQVDGQHHQLFDLANSLAHYCASNCDREKLKSALDFLVNYTVQHFNDEEALQLEYNYPGFEEHKKKHEDFKITVGDLVQRFEKSGSSSDLGNDIKTIVVQWLVHHILSADKKIGVHIDSCCCVK